MWHRCYRAHQHIFSSFVNFNITVLVPGLSNIDATVLWTKTFSQNAFQRICFFLFLKLLHINHLIFIEQIHNKWYIIMNYMRFSDAHFGSNAFINCELTTNIEWLREWYLIWFNSRHKNDNSGTNSLKESYCVLSSWKTTKLRCKW